MLTRWTTLAAACAIIPTATAFYPYAPASDDGTKGQTRRDPVTNVHSSKVYSPSRPLTLPLRRVPIRPRKNAYNIVNSDDPKQKNSVAVDQDGGDLSYIVAVSLGTSDEEFHLLLDSAASNTWVMGESCKSEACGRHNVFGAGSSSTLKTETKKFSITYGTGSVSGTTASDTFHVGTVSTELTFGLANNVSQEFNSYPMDGILGLGKNEASDGDIDAAQLIETLFDEGLIAAKLYGLHFSRASDGLNDGELNMGEVNKDRFDGDLNWLSTMENDNGFWEVAIGDAGADGKSAGLKDKSAIVDTGTSFIFLPEDDATAVHKLIDGYVQNGESFTVPCSTKTELTFKLGSTTYSVPAKDWIGAKTTGDQCRSYVFGRQTFGVNQWLLGDVFLKNVYTVFDFDNDKVGFGVKSAQEDSSNSSTAATATSTSTASNATASSNATGDPILPPGASSTDSPNYDETGSNTSESEPTATPDQPGSGPRTASASIFALFVALGSLTFLHTLGDMYI